MNSEECIYLPSISDTSSEFKISGSEVNHLKALRIRIGEFLMVSSGAGMMYRCIVSGIGAKDYTCRTLEALPEFGENSVNSALALGIIENRERFEFALEKAVELGINDFYPLVCDYSQKKVVNIDRLRTKAIAAMCQTRRSRLPDIHNPLNLNELLNQSKYNKIVIAEQSLKTNYIISDSSLILLIGPEGGFSEKELSIIIDRKNTEILNLGPRRLRAETAAITGLTKILLV
ncbi:MAG: rRNA (uracil1498-N3)-methyltransferase [Bacteroidota bacterium]|nr:rRNA (uracil1498-N3)-methyltransferase [Bacteroidota bacterium]